MKLIKKIKRIFIKNKSGGGNTFQILWLKFNYLW